jgi:hypothetical protein
MEHGWPVSTGAGQAQSPQLTLALFPLLPSLLITEPQQGLGLPVLGYLTQRLSSKHLLA